MAPPQNLLQLLRSRTIVDCDTMDVEVPQKLGKFVDCTSNQAIALGELTKPSNESIVNDSISLSNKISSKFPEISKKQLAVEIAMVKLQVAISHHISGFVHVQTNPYYSYDTGKTVENARRIIQIFKHLDTNIDVKRVCIKIPSTWEGLKACGILESSGTSTLATTLFTLEQASLAAEMGCRYIAPYVNELQVHFEPDRSKVPSYPKDLKLSMNAQRMYEKHGFKTQVLPASLTSTHEIMKLVGVHHITIAPGLLVQLAEAEAGSNVTTSLFDEKAEEGRDPFVSFKNDEAGFRIAFTRSVGGEGERKLSQAINIFCDMQDKMEELLGK